MMLSQMHVDFDVENYDKDSKLRLAIMSEFQNTKTSLI